MWLVFLFFILLVGIVFSNIEINIYKVHIKNKNYKLKIDFRLNIFRFFSVLLIKIDENKIKLIISRLNYKKFNIKNVYKKTNSIINKLNIRLNKMVFILEIGLEDILLTNSIVVLLSGILPNVFRKCINTNININKKKIGYRIVPKYNSCCFNFDGNIKIDLSSLELVKFYLKNIKNKNAHNKIKNYNVKETLNYE